MTMFIKLRNLKTLLEKYPILRGMLSYGIIWPTCSFTQEYLEHGTSVMDADWGRAARFGIFGSLFMSPFFYGWLKLSGPFFKGRDLKTAVTRAAIEQVTYGPIALTYFFFGMTLLEGKSVKESMNEVRQKFWPVYKAGFIFWPSAQVINFYFIADKNRPVFLSGVSFIWTIYLAHMKSQKIKLNQS